MKLIFFLVLGFLSLNAFAIGCDCDVQIYSPMTGSHKMGPTNFKTYELEEFSTYGVKNQKQCFKSCQEKFEDDMPTERLKALLVTYAQSLIQEKALGYNCTGLTTLKFPVRVKARLGPMGLGNVSDNIYVVNHEELCF
jgi:hypothetical protein